MQAPATGGKKQKKKWSKGKGKSNLAESPIPLTTPMGS